MKVCVAFFEIMQSLSSTRGSIFENVISPLSTFFDLKIFAHFYDNSFDKTAEGGLVENNLFSFDDIKTHVTDDPEAVPEFQDIKSFGDYWNNDFKSTLNLFLRLKSLEDLHEIPQVSDSDICLFLRPDIMIHDALSNSILSIRNLKED